MHLQLIFNACAVIVVLLCLRLLQYWSGPPCCARPASGLLCYGESGTSEQCAGVCATLTALEDGTINNGVQIRKGLTLTSCLPDVRDKTGCRETMHGGIKVRGCLCNTDLCNGGGGGGGGRGDGSRGSGGRGQGDKTSGLQCYGESGAPEQCTGVCGTMTALEDGTTTDGQQIRKGQSETGCLPDPGISGCIEKLFVGIQTRVCVCKTDLCNGEGQGNKDTKGDAPNLSEIGAFFKRPVVIGGIAGGVALIVLICCVVCCCKRSG